LFVSGGLARDLGAVAQTLVRFWKTRQQRFAAQERQALFARLFGTGGGPSLAMEQGRNQAFEPLLIDLAEALYTLDANTRGLSGRFGRVRAETPLRLAATRLAANLIPRSGGLATFAARDLLAAIEEALLILKETSTQRAVGATSVWAAVANIARLYLQEEVDVASHVVRAKSGMTMLVWLAEHLPHLEDTAMELASPDHPVVAAAGAWLQASLALAEQPPEPALAHP
jgi:hypothetical protein